ncbi:hypothetical protein VIGAN_08340100, partial [Vigna angularis var. angularis]
IHKNPILFHFIHIHTSLICFVFKLSVATFFLSESYDHVMLLIITHHHIMSIPLLTLYILTHLQHPLSHFLCCTPSFTIITTHKDAAKSKLREEEENCSSMMVFMLHTRGSESRKTITLGQSR